jgi:hypothetical protein
MTRKLLVPALAFALSVWVGQPWALAGGALIETTAPVSDRSEASVKAAVIAAIDRAVRGAAAMGFVWFELRDAQLSGNEVAIQILATDEGPDSPNRVAPDERPGGPEEEEEGLTEEPLETTPTAESLRVDI